MNSMKLAEAKGYANQLSMWLRPYCERLEVAGSIRRERPQCNDVDIVCIPKIIEEADLTGEVVGRRNLVQEFVERHVKASSGRAKIVSQGDKQIILELPNKVQLDLWFADDRTWATRLMCRTGSMKHNIQLCEIAKGLGLHWNPYEGIEGKDCSTEEAIYKALGLKFIEPKDRESVPAQAKDQGTAEVQLPPPPMPEAA